MSKSKIHRILKQNNLKPYKSVFVQRLFERDFEQRLRFAMWILQKIAEDSDFINNLMITDECVFATNGVAWHQNSRTWSEENPNWRIEGSITAQTYVEFLRTHLFNILENMALEIRKKDVVPAGRCSGAFCHYCKKLAQ